MALLLLVNGFFPALWILFTSLKTEGELTQKPITWLPADPTLQNYAQAFTDQPLLTFLFNSFAVALLSTALTLFIATGLAYFLMYEVLHLSWHAPAGSWVARLALVRWLGRLHRRHHDPARMTRCNFNITWPIGDLLFGTLSLRDD